MPPPLARASGGDQSGRARLQTPAGERGRRHTGPTASLGVVLARYAAEVASAGVPCSGPGSTPICSRNP